VPRASVFLYKHFKMFSFTFIHKDLRGLATQLSTYQHYGFSMTYKEFSEAR
jgi:hypothetical protein